MNVIILGSGDVSARQEHVVTAVYVQKRGRKVSKCLHSQTALKILSQCHMISQDFMVS